MNSSSASFSKLRLGVAAGFSYLTAPTSESVPDNLKDHINNLRSGYHIKLDFNHFFREYFGIGAKYSLYRSQAEMDYISNGKNRTRSDDITNHFLAPSINTRASTPNESVIFVLGFSPGLLTYKNKSSSGILTGKTFSMSFDLGVDFKVARRFYMGIGLSYMLGTLTKYTLENGAGKQTVELDKNNYESLARLDLTAGIRLYK